MPKLTATDMSEGINEAQRVKRLLEKIASNCAGCFWGVGKAETCTRDCIAKTSNDILKALEHGNFSLGLIDNLTGKLECRNNDACYREAARKAKDKRKNHHASKTNGGNK